MVGLLWGLAMPAWQALVPDLVPASDLVSAVSLNTVQFNLARAIGPAAGGVILAVAGPAPAFAANALSYLAAGGALAMVHARSRPASMPLTELGTRIGEAVSYAWKRPQVRTAVGVTAVVILLGSPVYTLPVIFAATVFHVDAAVLGLLMAATAVGAVPSPSRVRVRGKQLIGHVLPATGAGRPSPWTHTCHSGHHYPGSHCRGWPSPGFADRHRGSESGSACLGSRRTRLGGMVRRGTWPAHYVRS